MMMNFLKKNYPHILAVLAFFLMTVVYFAPTMQGKDLIQDDAINSRGWGEDLRKYHEETGEYAHWSNAMFGGMPANYTYMPHSVNIFRSIGRVLTLSWMGWTGRHNGYIFLSFVCFYIFLLSIGCRSWLSFIGAVAYTFCSYNFIIINAGHMNKALVMATMAPIIGGVIMCYRGKLLAGSLVTLVFAGLNVYWNHQQISYYLLLTLIILAVVYLVYALREGVWREYLKSTAVLAVVAVLAVLPSIGQLWPTLDYTKESMRGGSVLQQGGKEGSGLDIDYAFAWSYGVEESLTLLVPNIYGASSHYNLGTDSETYKLLRRAYGPAAAKETVKYMPSYWGAQPFTSGPVYVGAIVCFLFVLGLVVVKGRERWWLAAATLLSLVLAWGKYMPLVNNFLFEYLPLYNKFRAPSMALVIASLTMVALGVLAVKRLVDAKEGNVDIDKKSASVALCIAFSVAGGTAMVIALFGGSMFGFSAPGDAMYPAPLVDALRADREAMLVSDAWRSFGFIAAAFVLLLAYVNTTLRRRYLMAILAVLVIADLWVVDKRFLSWDMFVPQKEVTIPMTDVDRVIMRDKHPNYRVLNTTTSTFNDSRTSYFHKSVGGYSPAKLRRYQDVIDRYFGSGINMNIVNMLNVRYVIVQGEDGAAEVCKNPGAFGNCWFVDYIRWTATPDEEIAAIGDADLLSTAFVEEAWRESLAGGDEYCHPVDSSAFIYMNEYKNPGHITYKSYSPTPQLALFSEVYYKTWKAYIDGEEVPLVRANYLLRAVPVPAGEHSIELRCVDEVIIASSNIALCSSWLVGIIMLLLAGAVARRRVKKELPCP